VQRGRGKGREEGKARVAACKASGLRQSYYPYGYSMMYASEEEEKGRVRRGRGKKREGGKHGCMARGGHRLLQVSLGPTMSYPCTTWGKPTREGKGAKGKKKGKERKGKHGRMARGGHGLLKVSLGPTMPYPSTPCRRPPLKRPHARTGRAACGRLITSLNTL
jgi:hypothetical protein